ncbi:uncharacterized protein LOC120786131 isoform X2 [Xiphias gladius]|uniref:uncharacterized protein LOC120786131 isoform X2 n=1 Tax=Xiphias gladius TaxID=8245 RepID=UPI001A98630C|nr:uncharacterized protein LOC120786131 isoform X2 [Xiphias gladius]
MEYYSLRCQVCLTKFKRVSDFKKHVHSWAHQQKMEAVFQKDMFSGPGFFPFIVVMDPLAEHDIKQPIIGLCLVTLCFSREARPFFYLCHACAEKCPPNRILCHLSSGDHCCNYFNYTDPNVLSFSWMPSRDMRAILRPQPKKGNTERRPGTLQMLDLPKNLMEKLETSTYYEVMQTLSENDKLLKLFEADKPKRMTIQTYHRDSNRIHPLLGMQHIVECICVGPTERRYYLCTLCRLTLATHMIIKHVLSFDHIFCYFKAWHPSTLLSKECYKDYNSISSMILDFAKQTEEIHGTENTEMKQLNLNPAEFTSMNFTCYAEALKKLESITKEREGSSLIKSIKPGKKLERRTASVGSVAPSYKLRCQECSIIFDTQSGYLKHLSDMKHKQMLKKFFREAERADGYDQTGWEPSLGLYEYLQESLKRNEVVIGSSLVVGCVSTQLKADPIYVCFACQDCFAESFLRQHFQSQKHLIHTLLYQNPWRLPFGWENHLDVKVLKSMGWEEEKERGPNQKMLKVLDIPYQIFHSLIPPSYPKVMARLELYHSLLKQEVPRCETYSKLKQNERFPLLGKQFLVMHHVCLRRHQSTNVGFLCLLCQRRLSDGECYAHVFSREHVATFLDRFHPGSLSSSTDAETLLDLAKQAARIHSISNVQVIKLDNPILEPCSYDRAICIVASAKRRHGGGTLEPHIRPSMKLSHRETLKEVDKDHVRENHQKNSRMVEGCENKTSQKSTDENENIPKKFSVKLGSEIVNKRCVESEGYAEKGSHKEIPTPSEKESERRREVFSKTSPDEITNAGRETCQLIKEEKIEEPTMREPSGEIPESCQNTDKDDVAANTEEKGKTCKKILTKLKSYLYKENERERLNIMSEKSQEVTCSNGDVGRVLGHKRQRLNSKDDTSCEEPQKMPSGVLKGVTTADEGESGKTSHGTVKEKAPSNENQQQAVQLWQYVKKISREPVVGLSALLECYCDWRGPVYLCECCSLKIPEKNIVSHVTGFDHQKMYLVGFQKLAPLTGKHQKRIRHLAALFEQERGYGEAQVVDLDEEIYNNISKQNFNSAIQSVKAFQAQQDSGHELTSTSALSGIQPVHTLVPVHAQHEVYAKTDNIQVVELDSDSEESEVQPSSVTAPMCGMTETTSKTTEVAPQSNTDVKMSYIKGGESADRNNTCLTVSRRSENASSLHVSKSGANTTSLHSDSTGNISKDKILPNTTVEPFTIVTTSKIVGTSQTAATSHFTITTPSKSLTAISKCTDKSSSCTAHATKSTAVVSKLTGTTSNCTTATTKSMEMPYKCVSATSSTTASTIKLTAADPSSSKTTIFTAHTSCCTTTTAKCREPAHKCTATTSRTAVTTQTKSTATTTICTATTAKYTAPSSKLTGPTSTSSMTISNTNSTTKSATLSKALESRTGAASRVTVTSCKAAPTSQRGSTVVPEATCRATPAETASKITVTSQTTVTIAAGTSMAKKSVKVQNTEASAKTEHRKRAVGPNANTALHVHKSNPPAAPHLTKAMSASTEHKNPPTEPSHTSKTKTKPSEHLPKVGLNQLIKVSCEGRRQVYCQLCAVRLKSSSHLIDFHHMYNYVKMKYPEWNAKLGELESELEKRVARLAEVEKDVESQSFQNMEVTNDVYKKLAALPGDKAVERLKAMVRRRDLQVPSSSTTETAQALRQQVDSASQCEVSSPDDGMCVPKNEMTGLSANNQPEQENKHELQTVLVHMSVEKPHDCADPLATDSQSAGTFALTPHTCQETLENRQQQERMDPEIQDAEKISPLKSFSPDPLSSAAVVNTEQQNQSTPSLKAEHVAKDTGCSPGLGRHSASQAHPRISTGERTQSCSNFSAYLRVEGLDTEPVIGLGSVWECLGKPSNSFFLCESCSETLSENEICQHMVSPDHQLKYMLKQYPHFMRFWLDEDLLQQMKLELLKEVAQKISQRERFNKMDAQSVLLEDELYECVRMAPFSEALKMVQNIKKKQKLIVFCPPISNPQPRDEQPEKRQSQKGSFPMEALETDQKIDNGSRQKTEKHHLEETAMAGDLDGVKHRTVSSPLDMTSVSSKADSVVSPFPGTGKCHSPKETCRSFFVLPEFRPPASQHQRPRRTLQLKQTDVHSEFQSFCTVCPKTTQTLSVFPRDKCPPTRKRPADTSVETLVRPCTSNPQREEPLPPKCTRSSLQQHFQPSPEPASKSTTVRPCETPLSQKDKNTGSESDEWNSSIVDCTQLAHLIALVRERKSERNITTCKSASDNVETSTSCANNSYESGVERRWDSNFVQTKLKVAENKTRWDQKCQQVKATVSKNPPSTESMECMFSTTPPVVLGYKNQHVTPNSNPFLSANNSSLEGYSTRGNLLFRATEAEAVSTTLPSARTADPSELQNLRSFNAHNMFGNVTQLKPNLNYCVATNHNSGQTSQPQGSTETDTTRVCQLPLRRIITARTDPANQQFMGGYKRQDHTDVNRCIQVAQSLSTVETVNPSNTLSASGAYGQYSQLGYVRNGQSCHLSSEAVAGYTTPDKPPIYNESLYQHEGYTARGLYPG